MTPGEQFLTGLNRSISHNLAAQGLKPGTAGWNAGYQRETDNFMRQAAAITAQNAAQRARNHRGGVKAS